MRPSPSRPERPGPAAGPAAPAAEDAAWAAVRTHLESLRREVVRQIVHYPPPITACDAQFNHLLEQRDGLADALRRLEAAGAAATAEAERARALDAFLVACPYIAPDVAGRLRDGEDGR